VESPFALADRIEARLRAAQRQLDVLTPSLLARAFRGELVPQEPNDEPASAMLERIKARKMTEDPHLAGRSSVRTMDLRGRKRPPEQ
jgi:type I restriction enzyme S subunit